VQEKSQLGQFFKIVAAINLKPICLLSSDGGEQFILVHEKVFQLNLQEPFYQYLTRL
jgi:hypothetical protein